MIRFLEFAELHGALQACSCFSCPGEHQYAACFAVEAERHAEDVRSQIFATGADEARPRAIARAMTDGVRRLVENEEVWSFLQDPTAQFFRCDEPSPIRSGHADSIVDGQNTAIPMKSYFERLYRTRLRAEFRPPAASWSYWRTLPLYDDSGGVI